MSKGIGSLGEQLDDAVVKANMDGRHVELPQLDKTMALCILRTHRSPDTRGNITVSALSRVSGDIIVGPYVTREDKPTEEALVQLVRARRWVMSPVTLGDGSPRHPIGTIAGNPSICPTNRIATSCPMCGHKGYEWKDSFMMRNKEYNPQGHQYGPDTVAICNARNGKGGECGVRLDHHKMFCTAFDARPGRNDDPVIQPTQRDQVLHVLMNAWKAGPPDDGKPTLELPRLWAVYPLDAVPDNGWTPTDPRALRLAEKAAGFQTTKLGPDGKPMAVPVPLGILPYGIAKQYHRGPEPISTALKACWLESDEVAMGWISVNTLAGGDPSLGYKRELWSERATTYARPRRQQEAVYVV